MNNEMCEQFKKYDVVIIGGGTSGCCAAYNCAKLKLKTLLVEKNNYLGGLMSGGLVVPVMKSSVGEINSHYYNLLVTKAKEYNAQITYSDGNDGWFNPEILKIVLADILSSKKIKPYLDIFLETDVKNVNVKDRYIKNIVLNFNLLSIPILSTYYIDASGLGVLSKLSGCHFLDDSDLKQQNSIRFIVANVNIRKFCNFILKLDKDRNITNTYQDDVDTNNELHFTTASTWDKNKKWALDKYLKEGVEKGILKDYDRSYFQIFSVAGGYGQVAFNCPRLKNFNNSVDEYSNELISGYEAIYRLYCFIKSFFPGFENSIITNIATQTGIREGRRIKSKYIYKKEDLLSGKTFDTPVLEANYGIDIHLDKINVENGKKPDKYQLPLESLMSYDIKNLFAIGKLVGADFYSHSALRVQKSCMSMGEGVAKYIRNILK